jgi:YfiH family protein
MLNESHLIIPEWPAPPNVKALQTIRQGGISKPPYNSMTVAANRQALSRYVPSEPVWLKQVHGTRVIDAAGAGCLPEADAAYAREKETVCCVMTADCLPILVCDEEGTIAAAIHAGWRGLLNGVIEQTLATMQHPSSQLMAWLGPAIGPGAFEVGSEVRGAFMQKDRAAEKAFTPTAEKWLADIYLLARQRLNGCGVSGIYGGEFCTFSEQERFFSYRRDGVTGRMATLIWLQQN